MGPGRSRLGLVSSVNFSRLIHYLYCNYIPTYVEQGPKVVRVLPKPLCNSLGGCATPDIQFWYGFLQR